MCKESRIISILIMHRFRLNCGESQTHKMLYSFQPVGHDLKETDEVRGSVEDGFYSPEEVQLLHNGY